MKIFRYLKSKWAIVSLEGRYLKTSDPTEFNDTFEISPKVDPNRFDRAFVERLARRDYIIREAWDRLKPNLYNGDYELFKNQRLRNIDAEIDKRMQNLPDNIKDVKKSFRTTFSGHWRLLCFTRSINSILLWSHYADSHKGIALEFDSDDEYISDVGSEYFLNVVYSSKKPEFTPWHDVESFASEIKKTATWKSLEWAYEEEVRLILPRTKSILHDDFFPFRGNPVRAVYLGAKCSDNDRNKVAEILASKDYSKTTLLNAKVNENEYRLNFEKIDV